MGSKEFGGLLSGKGEGLLDGDIPIVHRENLWLPAQAVTLFAPNIGGWEEAHLHTNHSCAVAGGTTSWSRIMREVGSGEARLLGRGKIGVKGTKVVHQAEVGGDGGARGFSDRRLVDFHHSIDGLGAMDGTPARVFLFSLGGGGRNDDFAD